MALPGIETKLNRADEHLGRLRTEIAEWLTFATSFDYEDHHEGRHAAEARIGFPKGDVSDDPSIYRAIRVRISKPIPPEWSVTIGDAVHNLRSSLDLLVWELSSPPIGTGASRDTEFPIYQTVDDFRKSSARKLAGLTPANREIVESLKPYKGGGAIGDSLELLNRLSRYDKHRTLNLTVAIPTALQTSTLKGEHPYAMVMEISHGLADGDLIGQIVVPKDSVVAMRAGFRIYFEKAGPTGGADVAILSQILHSFKTEILPKFAHLFP